MKNLFKKTTSTSSGDLARTPKKIKQSKISRKKKSSSTPPVTPSPTKDASNISVRVISSQKLSLYHDKSTDADAAVEPDPRNHPQLGTMLPISMQSLAPSTASYESNLFDAVLGFGCSLPGAQSLSTIPEEHAEWGIPPSSTRDENDHDVLNICHATSKDADFSFDEHDDFEVVLEPKQFGADDDVSDVPMFCRPCGGALVSGTRDDNTTTTNNNNAEKKKRRFKMPKMKGDKSKKAKEKKANVDDAAVANANRDDDASSNGSAAPSTSSSKRKDCSQKNKGNKVRKELSLKKVQIGKQFHSKFHKKKAGNVPKEQKKTNLGRWKCVHDDTCNRVYYYHTLTREVSWDRPAGFVEWRVSHDLNQRRFFYNVITKRTTWDTPDDFVVWKEIKDPKSGKMYYYNVLNKKTTWEKPSIIKDTVERGDSPGTTVSTIAKTSNVKDSAGISNGDVCKPEVNNEKTARTKSAHDRHTETAKETLSSKPVFTTNEEAALESQGIIADLVRVESELPSVRGGNVEEPPKIVKTENHVRLAKLLLTYCPDEKDNNSQLMAKCRGQETSVIKAIEGLVDETPFDELRLAIFSYVKSTLREMGEEPFDERKTMWKRNNSKPSFAVPSPRRIKKVNTYGTNASIAGYSMNTRELSHVTGRSNTTERTNRIKNTSSRLLGGKVPAKGSKESLVELNEKWQNMSFDNSVDYLTDVTDDENQEKVVLDMKIVPGQSREDGARESKTLKVSESKEMKVEAKKEMARNVKEQAKKVAATPSALVVEGSLNNSNDAMTLESAYAADNDGETDDREWEEEEADDVSTLSDCFGPSIMKRYMKEKKILTKKEESLRKKAKQISKINCNEKENKKPKIVRDTHENLEESELNSNHTFQYTSLNPNRQDSNLSLGSEQSSIGYEELPRTKYGQLDEDSVSSWDDDTVTTNSSA